MKNILHLDWETRSACDLKSAGLHAYAEHPSTDIILCSWAFDEEKPETWWAGDPVPERITEHMSINGQVMAHNAPFEMEICNQVAVYKYDWPTLLPEQCVCTMAMSYAMGLPGGLDATAEALGLPYRKDAAGYRLMLQMSQPRRIEEDGTIVWWDDEERRSRLAAYGKQDIIVEREVGKRLFKLTEEEFKVWLIDYTINSRGVAVDVNGVKTAIKLVEHEKQRLDLDMKVVTGGAVQSCTATAQLTDWLRWKGIEVQGVAKNDIYDLLAQPLPKECRDALLLRQEAAKSSTAKLQSIAESTCKDGRIRGLYQYCGAGTGRWASRRVQVQNLPRPKLDQRDIEKVFEMMGSIQ